MASAHYVVEDGSGAGEGANRKGNQHLITATGQRTSTQPLHLPQQSQQLQQSHQNIGHICSRCGINRGPRSYGSFNSNGDYICEPCIFESLDT